jgi:hypothetical protein
LAFICGIMPIAETGLNPGLALCEQQFRPALEVHPLISASSLRRIDGFH